MKSFKDSKKFIKKGEEALKCLERKEFDFTEFWFDDILSDIEDLPAHLRHQDNEESTDVHENLHSYKDYATDGEKGTVWIESVLKNVFIRKEKKDENADFSIHS